MPKLTKGLYEIRYIPKGLSAPFPPGGMYATAQGFLGGPVTGEALGPSAAGEQVWDVESVEGKDDHFIIWTQPFSKDFKGVGPVLPGWALTGTGRNDIVNLKVQATQWKIQACNPGPENDGVYTIEPVHAPKDSGVGVSFIVDLDKDNDTLFLNTWPLHLPGPIIARWQFIKATLPQTN